MLKMAQINYIKHLYENEGKTLRGIARETNLSFQTVKKYACREDWNEEILRPEPERYPVLGPYLKWIDQILEDDKRAPRKQRHTIRRIYNRLVEEKGFQGSYGSVKKYIRKKKQQEAAGTGYLPIAQPMGHAQVDFGEFVYLDKLGKQKKGHALTVSFPYSNAAFTQVFPAQNQECLLEGLKRVFEHIGGVPIRLRADNMTTAVVQVLDGTERVLTDGFTRFMLHYRFQTDFCNPAAGNEKGNVENKVGYSRRNYFVPMPAIEDFSAFNEALWALCEKDHQRQHYKKDGLIAELWEEEREKLLFLPEHPYQVFRYETYCANHYGAVTIETNSYGLPPSFAREIIQTKLYYDRIEFYHNRILLKTYRRSYERNEEVMDWTQYVGTLCRKPGAAPHTRFFHQLPKLWQEHLRSTSGKERKSALLLLQEIVSDGNQSLCDEAISLASECGKTDTDSIRQCYYMISKKERHPAPLALGSSAPQLHYNPNLSVYDGLMGGGNCHA